MARQDPAGHVATGHVLYAREALPAGREGHEFSVLGDFEASVWDLFRVLYDRIRRALALRHVERGELGWQITDAHRLVGRILPRRSPAKADESLPPSQPSLGFAELRLVGNH